MSLKVEYEHALSLLTGDAFQEEVSVRLATNILSFQYVPRKPHGDGGLDGLSHDSERAYCCYGPEFSSFKTAKELTADIVEKFKSDLCKHRSRFIEFLSKHLARNAKFQTIIFTSLKEEELEELRQEGVMVQTPPGKKWLQLLPAPEPAAKTENPEAPTAETETPF
jgi:hypothetical protein